MQKFTRGSLARLAMQYNNRVESFISQTLPKFRSVLTTKGAQKSKVSHPQAATLSASVAAGTVTNISTADADTATKGSAMTEELAQIFGDKAAAVSQSTFEPVDHNAIVQFALDAMAQLQEMTQLPYWSIIFLMTIILRISLIPIQNIQMKHTALSQFASPLFKLDIEKTKHITDLVKQKQFREEAQKVYAYFGTGPIKSMVGLMAIMPFYIAMFFLINTAIHDPVLGPEMINGGISPFKDLTAIDSTYAVPALAAISTMLMFEFNSRGQPAGSAMGKWAKWVVRGLTVCSIPILAHFPIGLFYYWIPSNMISAAIMGFGRTDMYRKFLKLPTMSQINRLSTNPKLAEKFLESVKRGAPMTGYDVPGLNAPMKQDNVVFFKGVNKTDNLKNGAKIIEKATKGAKLK